MNVVESLGWKYWMLSYTRSFHSQYYNQLREKKKKTLYASDGKCFFNILLIFRGLFKFLMYLCISGLIYYLLLVIFHRCWHFNQLCYIIKLGSVEGNLFNLCWMATVERFTQNSRISRKSLVSIHLFYIREQFLWEDDLQKPPQIRKKI